MLEGELVKNRPYAGERRGRRVNAAQHGHIPITILQPSGRVTMDNDLGGMVRSARVALGMTQAQLAAELHCSASTISRLESGAQPLKDVDTLRRLAAALKISPAQLGIATTVTAGTAERDDPVRRRQLLANLAVTAAAAAGSAVSGNQITSTGDAVAGDLLVARVRDAMLGIGSQPSPLPAAYVRSGLAAALKDFHRCRYGRLAEELPRLIVSGHAMAAVSGEEPAVNAVLTDIYALTTRMLIKLDDQQLGWLAADRARLIAAAAEDPLAIGEAARNLAVLARKAGWYEQATSIALSAAERLDLRDGDPRYTAERGLLVMSAAYTAAKSGDRDGMRELTGEAAAIAAHLGERTLLRDHGGGFGTMAVELHRISAEYSVGEAGAAIVAARRIPPQSLPTLERRARYFTDLARAFAQCGRREDCLRALLTAERHAPEEVHARPAIRDLVSGLLLSGRTSPELRGLAARCGFS